MLLNDVTVADAAYSEVVRNKDRAPLSLFLLKVAEFCNLNCTYCFMFNLNDFSYHKKPKKMSLDVVAQAAQNAARIARAQGTKRISFSLHGGEPTIMGQEWLRQAIDLLRSVESEDLKVAIYMQTNAVLIDDSWIKFAQETGIYIGVSMDGTREAHDKHRIDHKGKGSYDRVVAGLKALIPHDDVFTGTLTVIDPNVSGIDVYRNLRDIGVLRMDFLWPLDHNWNNLPPGFHDPEHTPYADYLIPIFDEWWEEDNRNVSIRHFENMIAGIMAYKARLDAIGGQPVAIVSIDTNGGIEPVDSLRACGDGFTNLDLNILTDPIEMIYTTDLFQTTIRGRDNLCAACLACPIGEICGAGYLPHRYKEGEGFGRPTVYCKDLWKLIAHITSKVAAEYGEPRPSFVPEPEDVALDIAT